MPGRVFISCGQHFKKERTAASQLQDWFKEQGYQPYVAIKAQSIQDVNSGIIGELKNSDYYVFIDFRREQLRTRGSKQWRGSLFTNQELAIAYLLGFEKVLFLKHKDLPLEGLLRYMASNAIKFSSTSEIANLVQKAVLEKGWHPSYTRHLAATDISWSHDIIAYGNLTGKFLYANIENRRNDLGALSAIMRLASITNPQGQKLPSNDRSPLKAAGQPGFNQVIWPQSHASWDLLMVNIRDQGHIYLNSALDIQSKLPVITEQGKHLLDYEVFAENFPILNFSVELMAKLVNV
jgi:hypothetical protein